MLAQIITENGQKKVIPLTADAGAGNPVGTVIVVCSNQIPSNYLPLGTQYDTSLYPVLYALLGTDTTPTASALGLPTLSSGQYAIKATSGLSENAQDNVVAQLNEERSYSTSEVNTGKKWIDGKNIYKKTVVIDNGGAVLAEDGSYEKSLGVANVDTVISLTGISKAGNQYIVIAGTDATIAGVYTVRPAYDISSGKVIAHIKGYANITEIIVTVEYTKTTD